MSTFTQKIKSQIQNVYNPPAETPVSSEQTETSQLSETIEVGGLFVWQDANLVSAHRLVVLIPNAEFNESEVAREIWKLAFPPGLAVLLLGLCPSVNEEPRLRRRLATLAALTRDPRVAVDVQLEFGWNWISRLKSVLESGDIVVCHAEHRTGLWHRPLDLTLARLSIPVITMKGLISPMDKSSSLLHESIFWTVSVGIVLGFFWLQMQALQISEAWAKNVLLGVSVLFELGFLWLWHSLSF